MPATRTSVTSRRSMLLCGLAAIIAAAPAAAQDKGQKKDQAKIKAVATTSVIADMVREVGGDRVDVTALVGPGGDAHVFSPNPAVARKLASAGIVFINGLGLEGWMTRLVAASGSKAPIIVVSEGITPRRMNDRGQPGRTMLDPHAWQSVANAKIYVANIRDGLRAADPANEAAYAAGAAAYLRRLDDLEAEVRQTMAAIPAVRREVITAHDAFGYFGDAYGMTFVAPEGLSTESEPSAKAVAAIITLIRREKIPAVFLENIADPRLMQEIARETGAVIGGTLYADTLSPPGGPAATYIDMMRHNVREFSRALH